MGYRQWGTGMVGVAVQVGVGVGVPWARAGGVIRRAKSTKRKQPRAVREQSARLLRSRRRRLRRDGGIERFSGCWSSVGFIILGALGWSGIEAMRGGPCTPE